MYNIITSIVNPCDTIKKEISVLKNTPNVNIFVNKINFLTEHNLIEKSTKECPVCINIKLCIFFDCMHSICIDCYPKMDKCYLCR